MEVKLPDICQIQYGFAFDSAKFSATDGTPLVRIRDVVRGYSETRTSEKCNEEYFVDNGDLLVGMDGEFNIARWQGGRALLNQRVCRLIPNDNIDKGYLFYFMPQALKKIEDQTPFVTVKHLSAKQLNSIRVPLPALDVQCHISTVLDKVNSLIFLRKQQLAKLDELVKARFVEMFGGIPSNEYTTIKEVCRIITDGTHQPPKFVEKGIPFLFISNIVGNRITYDTEKFISEATYSELIKRTPIEIGDILLSTVGSYGHPAIVKSTDRFCFQRHIAYLKPKTDLIDSDYFHGALLSSDVQQQIEERVKGIAQKTLNLSEIRTIRMPLPPISLQRQFSALVEQNSKFKLTIQQSLDKLEMLKKALMQEYFG